ncbi:protein GumO [Lysobacter helvus]|uniref:Protein GumO n=2 Tax=Lysobacteraceae TaxID=32033 RepID=A0ABM7Q1T8_9GAMM|nr:MULTISPECIES: beta-ketoacyl-ACP synthase 3 [Lysobacter]BCT91167.1 protein GumO [Lysobacter caseinilyticus]BCT94320.1 protein GumO [Lysobacter helvus]
MSSRSLPVPLRILGTGTFTPGRRVESTEFDARWRKPAGWTQRHTGIDHRHHATADETTSAMAAHAAREALDRAGLQARDLDLVVSACSVMEQAIPCSAVFVHRRLGLEGTGIAAFDVNATCLSFLAALDMVACMLAAGRLERALIVSSEIASAGLNWDDPDSAPLFGDGAAAVVVSRAPADSRSQLLAAHMETYSEGAELCRVRAGGTRLRVADDMDAYRDAARFEMAGKATYRLAAQLLPGYLARLFGRAGVTLDDLDAFVPHQASDKALAHLQHALRLPEDRLVRILSTHGNQMAASIPTALHRAIDAGRIVRDDLVALVGSGAGLSFGGAVLRY